MEKMRPPEAIDFEDEEEVDILPELEFDVEDTEVYAIDGVVISNDDVVFSLNIHKYWADVNVSPSMFVLAPPESEQGKDL